MIYDLEEIFNFISINIMPKLKGVTKRITLATLAKFKGKGGQYFTGKRFNVSRNTIRKGMQELNSGIEIEDKFHLRGRKKAEGKLHNLLDDLKDIVDSQSQTDPDFKTRRLFTRLTVPEIRKQLILQKGYTDVELPSNQTLSNKLKELGYKLTTTKKTKPVKKIKETDDIFMSLNNIREKYAGKENVVRISIDTKDKVKIGEFSRGGKKRVEVKAIDHDFGNNFITPFGILDLDTDEVHLTFSQSKITADFMVDTIEDFWLKNDYRKTKDTLIINADNGPENNSHRRQYIKRIVEFATKYNIKVILAYYPPYHSKYNPIERVWGCLEQHWNGDLLDSKETVLKFAKTMTWKGKSPFVVCSEKNYALGVKLKKEAMKIYESCLERTEKLEKWLVEINGNNYNIV